jgi:hypothetical protein
MSTSVRLSARSWLSQNQGEAIRTLNLMIIFPNGVETEKRLTYPCWKGYKTQNPSQISATGF